MLSCFDSSTWFFDLDENARPEIVPVVIRRAGPVIAGARNEPDTGIAPAAIVPAAVAVPAIAVPAIAGPKAAGPAAGHAVAGPKAAGPAAKPAVVRTVGRTRAAQVLGAAGPIVTGASAGAEPITVDSDSDDGPTRVDAVVAGGAARAGPAIAGPAAAKPVVNVRTVARTRAGRGAAGLAITGTGARAEPITVDSDDDSPTRADPVIAGGAAGPAVAGPVVAGPAVAGPVVAGPAVAGPIAAVPIAAVAGPAIAPAIAGPAIAGPTVAGAADPAILPLAEPHYMHILGPMNNLDDFVDYVLERTTQRHGDIDSMYNWRAIMVIAGVLLEVLEDIGADGLESPEFYRIRALFDLPLAQQNCTHYKHQDSQILLTPKADGPADRSQIGVGQRFGKFMICRWVGTFHLFKVITSMSLWWWYIHG